MPRQDLTAAAWCTVAYLVALVPAMVVSFLADKWPLVRILDVFLTVLSTALWAYAAIVLRRLLAARGATPPLVGALTALIWVDIVATLLMTGVELLPVAENLTMGVLIASLCAIGIAGTVFSIRLLNTPDPLYGLHQPFAYTSLTAYVGLATCVCFPVGIAGILANSVLQAMIFFRAADAGPLAGLEGRALLPEEAPLA
jgi:hypothetical protein